MPPAYWDLDPLARAAFSHDEPLSAAELLSDHDSDDDENTPVRWWALAAALVFCCFQCLTSTKDHR